MNPLHQPKGVSQCSPYYSPSRVGEHRLRARGERRGGGAVGERSVNEETLLALPLRNLDQRGIEGRKASISNKILDIVALRIVIAPTDLVVLAQAGDIGSLCVVVAAGVVERKSIWIDVCPIEPQSRVESNDPTSRQKSRFDATRASLASREWNSGPTGVEIAAAERPRNT